MLESWMAELSGGSLASGRSPRADRNRRSTWASFLALGWCPFYLWSSLLCQSVAPWYLSSRVRWGSGRCLCVEAWARCMFPRTSRSWSRPRHGPVAFGWWRSLFQVPPYASSPPPNGCSDDQGLHWCRLWAPLHSIPATQRKRYRWRANGVPVLLF